MVIASGSYPSVFNTSANSWARCEEIGSSSPSRPSSHRRSVAAATNVLVLLAIRTGWAVVSGAPVSISATPEAPLHAKAIAGTLTRRLTPGVDPAATTLSSKDCRPASRLVKSCASKGRGTVKRANPAMIAAKSEVRFIVCSGAGSR